MECGILNHEGKEFKIINRSWEEFHGITAAIMTFNEEERIEDFLKGIQPHVKKIVMVDGGSTDDTIIKAIPFVDSLVIVDFVGHYSNQRNRVMELVKTDWTLQLDPDEELTDDLWKKIPELIDQNKYDCWNIPRREFRDGEEDCCVYPDYQPRLFRSYCRYIRPTHNELVGFKELGKITQDEGLDILHKKKNTRHEERNKVYIYWDTHHIHEMGMPGEQTKNTFGGRY